MTRFRRCLSEVSCRERFPTNIAKFTGKHLCRSLFFDRDAGLRTATLFNKRLWHRYFPVNFAIFLRTPFFRTPLVPAFFVRDQLLLVIRWKFPLLRAAKIVSS